MPSLRTSPQNLFLFLLLCLAVPASAQNQAQPKDAQIKRQDSDTYNIVFGELSTLLLGGVRFALPTPENPNVRGTATLDLRVIVPTTMNSYDSLPGFAKTGRLGSIQIEISIQPFGKTAADIDGAKAAILSSFVEFEEKGADFTALPKSTTIVAAEAFESKRVVMAVRSFIRMIRGGRLKPRSGDRLQLVYDSKGDYLQKIFVEPGEPRAYEKYLRHHSLNLTKAHLIALEPVFALTATQLTNAVDLLNEVAQEPNSPQFDLRKAAMIAADLEFRVKRFYDETLIEVTTEEENQAENAKRESEHAMEPTSLNAPHSRYWKNKEMLDELAAINARLQTVAARALMRSCEVLIGR